MLNELKDENLYLKNQVSYLKTALESKRTVEQEYNEQIHKLHQRIAELEDWNADFQKNEASKSTEIKNQEQSTLLSNIDVLVSRNRQLETDLARLQLQQRNNQLALERLDEYEETITQLQEELSELRLNKKKQQGVADEDLNLILTEERKQYAATRALLEEARLQLKNEREQYNENVLHIRNSLNEKFEKEKENLHNEILIKEKQIQIERNEREKLEKELKNLRQFKIDHEKEIHVREILEKQIIELNEQIQFLESDKNDLDDQLVEFQHQLKSKDKLIENLKTLSSASGASHLKNTSPHGRNIFPLTQASSDRLVELENQIIQNEKHFDQMNSIYNQFLSLLPFEYSSSFDNQTSFEEQFANLFEQFSSYIGSFSIMQEEFDSLKQILIERQDELEKLRTHLELTTDKLTQLQEERSLFDKGQSNESDEDELEEILEFQQRAPSRQSRLSITPGEKQQLMAQNELLSSLLTEKEQELISLQQEVKSHEDLTKDLEILRSSLQQIEQDRDNKQRELNDIKNVLDEKLRETSSLKKEKMYFIEKLAELERERQEKQSIIQTSSSSKQSSPPQRGIPLATIAQNSEKSYQEERSQNNYVIHDKHLEISKRQHDPSLSYYHEYMHILTLYDELNTKYKQLEVDYTSLESLIQQKNEAYLQCQNELNTYQNLYYHLKKKSDDIDLLRSRLNEREARLQELINNENQFIIKQSELEYNAKLLEEDNVALRLNQQLFDQTKLDLKRITHERDLAVVEKKQIEYQADSMKEKLLQSEQHEEKLNKEVERLRHLEKSLRNQLEHLETSNREKAEIIYEFSTRNEHSQQELLINLEKFKYEYEMIKESNLNLSNQLQDQIQCTQNLQNSLYQYQQEREQYVNENLLKYQESLHEQISISARLTNENNELRQRLDNYNEILSSLYSLSEELKAKNILINTLQNEINEKTKQITESNETLEASNSTRIEKQLVKNILLSYFHTPIDKQQEAIRIISALVGFTEEEYQRVLQALSHSYSSSANANWLTGWLNANPPKPKMQSNPSFNQPDKSFAELLIQYVDQESLNFFPQQISNFHAYGTSDHSNSENSRVSASDKSTHLSSDKPKHTTVSTTSTVEHNIAVHNQSSLPKSSTLVDGLLEV